MTATTRWPTGEVGKVGVAIDSIDDMLTLFRRDPARQGHDLDDDQRDRGRAARALRRRRKQQGVPTNKLGGTVQNDILKEYIARGTYIFPPKPSCA
jgi:methylmalonyl-CoA mutase N-terminal domain/subunit